MDQLSVLRRPDWDWAGLRKRSRAEALRVLGDPYTADEAAQEAVVRAWRQRLHEARIVDFADRSHGSSVITFRSRFRSRWRRIFTVPSGRPSTLAITGWAKSSL